MYTRIAALAGLLIAMALSPSVAAAQCAGDCNANDQVSIDELIRGVNISLGAAQLSTCTSLDVNGNGEVTIDELVRAVNNALNGCTTGPTPTPTTPAATRTPTSTPIVGTPTPTTPPPVGCGDRVVDFSIGETCDDGNLLEGDSCPANCRIAGCSASGSTLDVSVRFFPPTGVDLAGVTVFVRYPEAVVRIPGSVSSDLVFERLSNLPENAFLTPNDLDYGIRLLAFSPDLSPISGSLLATITMDRCDGTPAPTAGSFTCVVEDAADPDQISVSGVTCAVTIP